MDKVSSFCMRSIHELQDLEFHVEAYQRGYKWDVQQVYDLLRDIDEFDASKGGKYCLQPIVARKFEPKEPEEFKDKSKCFELIDGQQRLTTIFILLHALGRKPHFQIHYKTRAASREFLIGIDALQDHSLSGKHELGVEGGMEKFEQAIQTRWVEYANANKDHDNIDNFHFFQTFHTVGQWRKEQKDAVVSAFLEKLIQNTEVIWYEPPMGQSAEVVFSNLNSGKIPLTGSELIKALLILQIQKESSLELVEIKQTQLAREWDHIEQTLQDDRFWYFIRGKGKEELATRIDFLFDLYWEKDRKGGKYVDGLYSYRKFSKIDSSRLLGIWEEIQALFQTLEEWNRHREMYHLIGYIVGVEFLNIQAIRALYKASKGKREFVQQLKDEIRARLSKEVVKEDASVRPYSLDVLNYEVDKTALTQVLLLYNVLATHRLDNSYRFPFERYHTKGWSLEHIHPQNPKGLETHEAAVAWLEEQQKWLTQSVQDVQDSPQDAVLRDRISHCLVQMPHDGHEIKTEQFKELQVIADELAARYDLHGISNMALLTKECNSALGNRNFQWKRSKLLELEAEGHYVPICTRNTFLKCYSDPEKRGTIQMRFWSQQDAQDYENNIKTSLKEYYGDNHK